MIRLHLGAGRKYFPRFINVDLRGEQDINSNIIKLPFDNDSADEIHSYHAIEHLHRKDSGLALMEWFRILKPHGKLVLELPCLNKIAAMIVAKEKNIRLTLMGLFGDPRDNEADMIHKWCYSKEEITDILDGVGFKNIDTQSEPVFHIARRDMRVTANKP